MPHARLLSTLAVAALLAAGSGIHHNAKADDFPSKKVTFIVATAAGGYVDTVTRIIADQLSMRFHQSFIVENRGGAGGNIAAKAVMASDPDGYTILATTTQLAINDTLYKGFSTKGLRPVAIPVSAPEVILAHPSNPAKTLADLIKAAKAAPLVYGSAGIGTGSYIEAQYLFKVHAKVETVHVPFPGGAPAINAALGNQIPSLAITVSPVIASINSGALRGLGVASAKRMAFIPDVPTFAESGFPNYYASSWAGFFAPVKTSDQAMQTLNAAINETLQKPEVQKRLSSLGVEIMNENLDKTSAYFNGEIERWGKMVRTLGLSVEN